MSNIYFLSKSVLTTFDKIYVAIMNFFCWSRLTFFQYGYLFT